MAGVTLYRGGVGADLPSYVREAMKAYDDEAKEKEREYRKHQKTFTALNADPKHVGEGTTRRGDGKVEPKEGAWEGPRLSFTLLIGIDVIWAGPASIQVGRHCLLCRGKGELPSVAVCVGCGRSGQDHHPELRSARPKPSDNRKYNAGRLKGGVA